MYSNLLIDNVPKTVIIDNKEYDINYDFRISIMFELLIHDTNISEEEKIIKTLELYYPILPHKIDEAIEKILWFYKCGKEQGYKKHKKSSKIQKQIYSFDTDDEYIYAAFLSQYNVDLQETSLHWWEFKALFNSLSEDNKICEIMKFRCMDLNKIKDKEEKAYYKEMQELYKIEEETTEEDLKEFEKWNNIL